MISVKDTKPNIGVEDIKPSMGKVSGETVVYKDQNILYEGMPIGLLLSLTYASLAGTAQVVRD